MTSQNIQEKPSFSSHIAQSSGIVIYVACLHSYNSGHLFGRHINCLQDADDIRAEIQEMLADPRNPCAAEHPEEWAIHDYEGFGSIHLSESHDIEEVATLAELISNNGSEIVGAALDYVNSADDIEEFISDHYAGTFESLTDFAYDLLEGTGELDQIPEHLRNYFSVEDYARDLEYGGDVFTVEIGYQ